MNKVINTLLHCSLTLISIFFYILSVISIPVVLLIAGMFLLASLDNILETSRVEYILEGEEIPPYLTAPADNAVKIEEIRIGDDKKFTLLVKTYLPIEKAISIIEKANQERLKLKLKE